ncbi:DUF6765 family protein [uncultured Fibrella sp.]|uniref:DUF6765 family protein n=1 Tax=uncultured Fibrella sp. TaxID=1284596 RepID=UPI0035CC74E2
MEAAGHYYTVYYVSLAVGFSHEQAKDFAFFTQMPDQVKELDATNLEIEYGKHVASLAKDLIKNNPRKYALHPIQATQDAETILRNTDENIQRFQVERTLHSLTGKSAKEEQKRTVQLLQDTFRDNFDLTKFGFLLHRLGDTFAHTRLGKTDELNFETPGSNGSLLYRSSFIFTDVLGHGHAEDGTFPDHPWQRETLFFNYVRTLYGVLLSCLIIDQARKITYSESGSKSGFSRRSYSLSEVEHVFNEAISMSKFEYRKRINELSWGDGKIYRASRISSVYGSIKEMEEHAQYVFKQVLFYDMFFSMHITADNYSPESEALSSYDSFSRVHSDKKINDLTGAKGAMTSIDLNTQSTQN